MCVLEYDKCLKFYLEEQIFMYLSDKYLMFIKIGRDEVCLSSN
jgi:hypothetical protein